MVEVEAITGNEVGGISCASGTSSISSTVDVEAMMGNRLGGEDGAR